MKLLNHSRFRVLLSFGWKNYNNNNNNNKWITTGRDYIVDSVISALVFYLFIILVVVVTTGSCGTGHTSLQLLRRRSGSCSFGSILPIRRQQLPVSPLYWRLQQKQQHLHHHQQQQQQLLLLLPVVPIRSSAVVVQQYRFRILSFALIAPTIRASLHTMKRQRQQSLSPDRALSAMISPELPIVSGLNNHNHHHRPRRQCRRELHFTDRSCTTLPPITTPATALRDATEYVPERPMVVTPMVPLSFVPAITTTTTTNSATTTTLKPPPVVQQQQHPIPTDDEYQDLYISPNELRPSRTLITGQCFNWRVVVPITSTPVSTNSSAWGLHDAKEWIGNLRVCNHSNNDTAELIIVMIRETSTTTLYRTLYTSSNVTALNVRSILYSYFQITPPTLQSLQHEHGDIYPLEAISLSDRIIPTPKKSICVQDLYDEWSSQCPRMQRIASCLPGVRILDQDPFYCMISFLCSSNNNIPRITKMLSAIQRQYGTLQCTIPYSDLVSMEDMELDITTKNIIGWEEQDIDPKTGNIMIYSFPSLVQLYNQIVESDLRTICGMGYRATYMIRTIQRLYELGGESYLYNLRSSTDPSYVQEQLIQFTGIGRKVADCIALFSLQQHTAIPVDVHVWNIARRDYNADTFLVTSSSSSTTTTTKAKSVTKPPTATTTTAITKTKSLTPTIYKQIGDLFRNKFPSYSGWAHSLLFVAELPSFRPALPMDLINDMNSFRAEEKARKVVQKESVRNAKVAKVK